MKLTHYFTGTLFALVATCATVLPAATLPQIKAAPKTVTAPKVPVVKVPTAPKIPVVKVPVAPKIPVVRVPVVKVPVAPKMVKVPTAPKVPAAPKVVKVPVAPKIVAAPKVVKAPVAVVDTSKLTNLKQKLPVQVRPVEARDGARDLGQTSVRGDRFVTDNFGPGAGAKNPGSLMDSVKQNAGKNDRNPLSADPSSQMRGSRNSQVSDGGGEGGLRIVSMKTSSNGNTVAKFEGGTIRVQSPDKKTMTVLFTNGMVLEKKDGQNVLFDPEGEPLPDDAGRSSGVVTRNDVRGLNAKKNSTSEPAPNDTRSNGGPVNTGATGTGKTGSLSQPAGDLDGKSLPSMEDANKNIQIKIDSKINTGDR